MKKFTLIFPDAKGHIQEDARGFWSWVASYADGSGQKFDWTRSKRGAMICCVQACRNFSRHYEKNVKYKWVEETV